MNDEEKKKHKAKLASLRSMKSAKKRGVVVIQCLPDTRNALKAYRDVHNLSTHDAALKKLLGISEIV